MARHGLLLWLLLAAAAAQAADLGGKWYGDDGATYYLRQEGEALYWYAEGGKEPKRTSLFTGQLRGDLIIGHWVDVPKGGTADNGELHAAIRENGAVIEVTAATGGFGSTRLTRSGHRAQAPTLAPECLDFNPDQLAIREQDGHIQLAQGDWWLFDFGTKEQDAETVRKIIQYYHMNQSCFIGKPDPLFRFLLVDGRAPQGQWYGEDCVAFQPSAAALVQKDGRWLIVDRGLVLFDFDGHQTEAWAALAAIKKYQFTNACYVGRPEQTFEYLHR